MSKAEPLLGPACADRHAAIGKAAWKLEDALTDRLVEHYPSGSEARELHLKAAEADRQYGRASFLLTLLTVFETPSWCETTDNFFSYMASDERCTIAGVNQEEVLLSDLPYVPPGWGLAIEVVLVCIIARKLLLERRLQIRHFREISVQYSNLAVINFGLVMCLLEVIDCAVFLAFRPSFRIVFLPRSGYMCLLPRVRRLALCISAVLGEFLSIAAFYVGTVVFFAWIAVVMFDDVTGTALNGDPVNKGFEDFRTTLNTMFAAGSTEDFVTCFLPTYTMFRASGLLWLVFLIIVQVLLLNLVLDTLVAAYTRYQEQTEELESKEVLNGIKEAFRIITEASSSTKLMTMESFLEFAKEFSRSPRARPIAEHNAHIVFRSVDKDGSGMIDEGEFLNICEVIQYDFWTSKEDSWVKDLFPGLWNKSAFQQFCEFVRGGGFDTLMTWVLMVNLLLVIYESRYDLNDWPETPLMENLELIFSLVYVLEVATKLCVWDWGFYWALRSNQFDFVTTWMLLLSSLLDELASSSAGVSVKRYMNILRLLRLLRVLKQLKRLKKVQLMVETICTIVSASRNIMTLLGVVTFFFSALSVQLWGGILYRSNERLEDTQYQQNNFWVLNFNDFGTAFGVWVVFFLCEYVADFPEAIARASDIPGSWIVFLLFYIGGVSVVFELVKAFTIEAFIELHKKWGVKGEEFGTLGEIEEEFKRNGLVLHYRVVGDLATHEKILKALEEEGRHGHRAGHEGASDAGGAEHPPRGGG